MLLHCTTKKGLGEKLEHNSILLAFTDVDHFAKPTQGKTSLPN